ncbi:helix-hairpin-helix domain-containing protein [Nocardioides jejuensis]|uniref:ComEA family DNA-binding protein n=1 Tax=Nocardioides jejuensis TaxID=2502782 RepID=A0A4R1CB33_9ACTN|nr:helix-hairpin-helix domain-containing protein [Nocardioides jejuensis]TCJ28089.1 ComEA family DNA-binding protein [Nocardioides jejuensis]
MGSRESYDEALAQRLALLRAELTGERAAAESARVRAEKSAARSESAAGEPEPPVGDGADAVAVAVLREPGRHASRRFPAVSARLPPGLLTPGAIAVVAVLLALGVGLVAWLTLRAQPQELPMAVPVAGDLATPVVVGGSAGASPAAGASAAPSQVVVHVAGKVRRPGIVVLSPGARVIDAVKAAGGARHGVDLGAINLARLLVDGEQILVGVGPAPGAAAGASAADGAGGAGVDSSGTVNLNTASESQLEELPGVGPVTAAAIVTYREEHGAFASVDQLLDVSGIGEATLAEIAPHATV